MPTLYSEEWQWAEFDCGSVTLCLHGGVTLPETIAGGRIALAVEDVDAAWAELKGKDASAVGELGDYSVCCAVEVRDPDGNTVILHRRLDGTCGQNLGTGDGDVATIKPQTHRDRLA